MRIYLLSFLLIFSVGCSPIKHLDQLLILKNMGEEQEEIDKYVEQQNAIFEAMLAQYHEDEFKSFSTQASILSEFGKPIMERNTMMGGASYTEWFYRYPVKFFASDKIYLYFDKKGNLKKTKFIEGKSLKEMRSVE